MIKIPPRPYETFSRPNELENKIMVFNKYRPGSMQITQQ